MGQVQVMSVRTVLVALLAVLGVICIADRSEATGLSAGTKSVSLVSVDGQRLEIGRLEIVDSAEGPNFRLIIASPQMTEEFLSMRPFSCLPHPRQMWCHLAYPFKTRGRITTDDLTDLEYALLFLWKAPDKVSIDAWNGLYFKLAPAADGTISGALHEADLNVLAVPQDDPYARPIAHKDLTPAEPGVYRFQRLEIR